MLGKRAFVAHCKSQMQTIGNKSNLRMSIPNGLDTLTSGLASIARLPGGTNVRDTVKSSKTYPRITKLYDVENNPKCRLVRECISELDLVVENLIPCGKDSNMWKEDLANMNQEEALPRMIVVEDTGEEDAGEKTTMIQGVEDIVAYLENQFDTYSPISQEDENNPNIPPELLSNVASFLRFNRGTIVSASAKTRNEGSLQTQGKKPLILYSYEGNQFCRLVREVLTELDLTYELRSAGKESPRRTELADVSGGSTQCPYMIDPNTGTKMNESKDIVEYLYKEYANWTPPNEILQAISSLITPVLKPVYKILAPLQAGEEYNSEKVRAQIGKDIQSSPVVVYTYTLSPFCTEAVDVLNRLGISHREISLGKEWVPLLVDEGGSETRAELGALTGQTSLPNIFVGGESIGGLFSGNPGLIPSLESDDFLKRVEQASLPEPTVEAD